MYTTIELSEYKWQLFLDSDGYCHNKPDDGCCCLVRINCDNGAVHYRVLVWSDEDDCFLDEDNDSYFFDHEFGEKIEFLQLERIANE
jgi:hypothetical protein